MTVSELIELLDKCDPDMDVMLVARDGSCDSADNVSVWHRYIGFSYVTIEAEQIIHEDE